MAMDAQQTLVLQSAHAGDLGALDTLLRARRHKSPLSLRTAIWSPVRPPRPGIPL